jgi:hypothetical protein
MTELDDAIKAANHHVDAALVEKLNKHITSLSDKKAIEYGKIYLSVAEKVIPLYKLPQLLLDSYRLAHQ